MSVQLLISAWVVVSRFKRLSPMLGSALTVQSLLGIPSLSPPLSAPPWLLFSLSQNKLTLKKKTKKRIFPNKPRQSGSSLFFKGPKTQGAWVAQSVKQPTLDFSSGHDLTVVRLSPVSGILSLPLPQACRHACSLSLSLSQNKHFFKKP